MPPRNRDYYKLLQVDPSADPEIIAAAYKRLAYKYHPDTNTSPDSTLRMQEINAAYEVLRDPTKRERYDRERSSHSSRPDTSYEETRRKRENAAALRRRAQEARRRREQAEAEQRRAEEERRKREEAEAVRRRAQEEQRQREQAEAERYRVEDERRKQEETEAARRRAEKEQQQRAQAEAERQQKAQAEEARRAEEEDCFILQAVAKVKEKDLKRIKRNTSFVYIGGFILITVGSSLLFSSIERLLYILYIPISILLILLGFFVVKKAERLKEEGPQLSDEIVGIHLSISKLQGNEETAILGRS